MDTLFEKVKVEKEAFKIMYDNLNTIENLEYSKENSVLFVNKIANIIQTIAYYATGNNTDFNERVFGMDFINFGIEISKISELSEKNIPEILKMILDNSKLIKDVYDKYNKMYGVFQEMSEKFPQYMSDIGNLSDYEKKLVFEKIKNTPEIEVIMSELTNTQMPAFINEISDSSVLETEDDKKSANMVKLLMENGILVHLLTGNKIEVKKILSNNPQIMFEIFKIMDTENITGEQFDTIISNPKAKEDMINILIDTYSKAFQQ
jgi:hypothetical protein